LNKTYIPYGKEGAVGAARQQEQDSESFGVSVGLLAQRVKSKATALYNNAKWDLVDAVEAGEADLDKMEPEALPEEMQAMTPEVRKAFVDGQAKERADLKGKIVELSRQRDAYAAEQLTAQAAEGADTLNEALTESVRKQAVSHDFVFAE
jgi:hypothetical protein